MPNSFRSFMISSVTKCIQKCIWILFIYYIRNDRREQGLITPHSSQPHFTSSLIISALFWMRSLDVHKNYFMLFKFWVASHKLGPKLTFMSDMRFKPLASPKTNKCSPSAGSSPVKQRSYSLFMSLFFSQITLLWSFSNLVFSWCESSSAAQAYME